MAHLLRHLLGSAIAQLRLMWTADRQELPDSAICLHLYIGCAGSQDANSITSEVRLIKSRTSRGPGQRGVCYLPNGEQASLNSTEVGHYAIPCHAATRHTCMALGVAPALCPCICSPPPSRCRLTSAYPQVSLPTTTFIHSTVAPVSHAVP